MEQNQKDKKHPKRETYHSFETKDMTDKKSHSSEKEEDKNKYLHSLKTLMQFVVIKNYHHISMWLLTYEDFFPPGFLKEGSSMYEANMSIFLPKKVFLRVTTWISIRGGKCHRP